MSSEFSSEISDLLLPGQQEDRAVLDRIRQRVEMALISDEQSPASARTPIRFARFTRRMAVVAIAIAVMVSGLAVAREEFELASILRSDVAERVRPSTEKELKQVTAVEADMLRGYLRSLTTATEVDSGAPLVDAMPADQAVVLLDTMDHRIAALRTTRGDLCYSYSFHSVHRTFGCANRLIDGISYTVGSSDEGLWIAGLAENQIDHVSIETRSGEVAAAAFENQAFGWHHSDRTDPPVAILTERRGSAARIALTGNPVQGLD